MDFSVVGAMAFVCPCGLTWYFVLVLAARFLLPLGISDGWPHITNEFCLVFKRACIECCGGFVCWLTALLLPGLDIRPVVSEFPSGMSPRSCSSCLGSGYLVARGLGVPVGLFPRPRTSSHRILFFCLYPWSWSYCRVFPRPRTSCQSDLALLAPNAETQSLSVAVDKLAPWLLSASFRSRLALLLVLACACFKTAASVFFLWKCHGVDKLAPWLLSASFRSHLALLLVLACTCFKTAASVSFLWKCHGFACSWAALRSQAALRLPPPPGNHFSVLAAHPQ
jgi:hypothetical protein